MDENKKSGESGAKTPKQPAKKSAAAAASKSAKKPAALKKTAKSAQTQKSELTSFVQKTTQTASALTKTAKKKTKSKASKRFLAVTSAILIVAVLAVGTLYYFDIPPLDFVLGDFESFKFYTYSAGKPPAITGASGELSVHIIDVGQGDSIFIQLPDGKKMLIDGGENRSAVGEGIINYILALYPGQSKVQIDYVILTHTDSDHCGSLDTVISSNKIDALHIYQPRVLSTFENDPLKPRKNEFQNVPTITTLVYSAFVQAVYEEVQSGVCKQIEYNIQGLYIEGANWRINFYNPAEEMYAKLSSAQDKNNVSPILALHFNSQVVLLTGDSDAKAETNYINNVNKNLFSDGFDGSANVLKIAHHGGKESTNADFLAKVQPQYALISCGKNNKYDHPRPETLARLAKYTSQIFRTDDVGSIALTISGTTYTVKCERQPTASLQVMFVMYDAALSMAATLSNSAALGG